jgi:hypothetical protein
LQDTGLVNLGDPAAQFQQLQQLQQPPQASKKGKPGVVTKVVHIRGLPFTGVPPDYLLELARPFSIVDRVVELRGKGQVFLQLRDADASRRMVGSQVVRGIR